MGEDLLNSLFWEYIGKWIAPAFWERPMKKSHVALNITFYLFCLALGLVIIFFVRL